MTPSLPPLLTLTGISKRFGEVRANRSVSWTLEEGRIYALLGENGAGKSTLMSILAGRYQPDGGQIALRGRRVRFLTPALALAAGIGMVYQRFMLVEPLSVAENILLRAGSLPLRHAREARRTANERSRARLYGQLLSTCAECHSLYRNR